MHAIKIIVTHSIQLPLQHQNGWKWTRFRGGWGWLAHPLMCNHLYPTRTAMHGMRPHWEASLCRQIYLIIDATNSLQPVLETSTAWCTAISY